MTPFRHQPLTTSGQQIRLLDLLPGNGAIHCHLRHAALTDRGQAYEALSYCWGATNQRTKTISINGLDFEVQPNLYTALWYLRSSNDVHRTLWIDAICINQWDEAEKSAQVPLMRDIYASCQRAVIWLGEHDYFTKHAFQGLQDLTAVVTRDGRFNYGEWAAIRRGKKGRLPRPPWAAGRMLELLHFECTFYSLFSRPWFSRIWVVQELALSPQAIVVCGRFQMDWAVISRAYARLQMPFETANHVGTLVQIRDKAATIKPLDILPVMLMVWHKECGNPVDKIYGLQGLATPRGGVAPVPTDYTLEAAELFKDFTRLHLRRDGNLQVLALCRGGRRASRLADASPSWAIDHEYNRERDPLPSDLISWAPGGWPQYPEGVCAGGTETHESSQFHPLIDGDLLGLQGHAFDSVAAVSIVNQPPTPRSLIEEALEDWKRGVAACRFYLDAKSILPNVKIYHPTGQPLLQAFWDTLTPRPMLPQEPKLLREGRRSHERTREACENVDRALELYASRATKAMLLSWLILSVVYLAMFITGALSDRNPPYALFFRSIRLTQNRRFFVTAGGYLGVGPRETRVGDTALILRNHGAPVVVMPGRRHWKIVGESYIYGIMKGEALKREMCQLMWFK